MNIRQNKQDLINEQKALINLIFAICMSFGEFRKANNHKKLLPSIDAYDKLETAKMWFPAGIERIMKYFEDLGINAIRLPDIRLGYELYKIGGMAQDKNSEFHTLQKLFRNRSRELSQFYSIVSILGERSDNNEDIEKLIAVKNQLERNFKVEVLDIFTANLRCYRTSEYQTCYPIISINVANCVKTLVQSMAKFGCYNALFHGLSMIQDELKDKSSESKKLLIKKYLQTALDVAEQFNRIDLIRQLKRLLISESNLIQAYTSGASAGALFRYFPVEIGEKIGSDLNLKEGLALSATCKLARQMALSHEANESKNQASLQRTLKQ